MPLIPLCKAPVPGYTDGGEREGNGRMNGLLKISKPKMPTEAELVDRAVRYHDAVGMFNLDMLPPDVLALSAETKFVDVPLDHLKRIE